VSRRFCFVEFFLLTDAAFFYVQAFLFSRVRLRHQTLLPLSGGYWYSRYGSTCFLLVFHAYSMIIQLAFSGTMCLAALSTVLDVVNHRSTPTPFGTQHIGKQFCLSRHGQSNPN
jgi:hypothetical protein